MELILNLWMGLRETHLPLHSLSSWGHPIPVLPCKIGHGKSFSRLFMWRGWESWVKNPLLGSFRIEELYFTIEIKGQSCLERICTWMTNSFHSLIRPIPCSQNREEGVVDWLVGNDLRQRYRSNGDDGHSGENGPENKILQRFSLPFLQNS